MTQKPISQPSTDLFYENLTLGLVKTLSNVPRITNVTVDKRNPCEKIQITNWEQRHNVYLPEDIKKFYLSTDGFNLHWSYQYAPNDLRRVGCINLPRLVQITLLRENVDILNYTQTSKNSARNSSSSASTSTKKKIDNILSGPLITSKTKIFEINSICDTAKVCLVYEMAGVGNPRIYLLQLHAFKWQFLSETFTEYLRMAIAHLGLPYWELCFSSFGLPSWTEQLFLLLAPHLLSNTDERIGRIIQPQSEQPTTQLDPNVFRSRSKGPKGPIAKTK